MLPSILACCKQQSKYSIDPEGVKDSDKTYASNLFDDISCYLIEYPNGTTLLKREFGVTIFSIFNTFVFFSFLAIRSQIIRCQTNDHLTTVLMQNAQETLKMVLIYKKVVKSNEK